MEPSGMWWSIRTDEAMVKVRAIYLSKDFEGYWDHYIEQEQQRVYLKGYWNPLNSFCEE